MEINKRTLNRFNKIKLRKIKVLNKSFLWKRGHIHLEKYEYAKCIEKIIIYLENYQNSPLILFFREEDNLLINSINEDEKWMVGYPDQGIIWKSKTGKTTTQGENKNFEQINLNNPSIIEIIIKLYYDNTWKPDNSSNSSHTEENALIRMNDIINKKNNEQLTRTQTPLS